MVTITISGEQGTRKTILAEGLERMLQAASKTALVIDDGEPMEIEPRMLAYDYVIFVEQTAAPTVQCAPESPKCDKCEKPAKWTWRCPAYSRDRRAGLGCDDHNAPESAALFSEPAESALLKYAKAVMQTLEEHGPSIVPHLMDTDDNDGERLRQAITNAEMEA